MINVSELKTRFQTLLRPHVHKIASHGFTANEVTLAVVGLSAFGGFFMAITADYQWPWILLPLLLFARFTLSTIHDMLTRESDKLDIVLKELGDVVSDMLFYLPFAMLEGVWGWAVVFICILSALTEMSGMVGIRIGASRRFDGPMGKNERALLFGVAGLLLGFGATAGFWLNMILLFALGLLMMTIYNRANAGLKEAAGK